MEVFLETLKLVVDNLGATVMLPIMIFVIALFLGAKPGKAFRAGITVGIAFIGINLVIGLMWSTLSTVGQAMVENLGIQRDIVDVGWPSAAAIAFGTSVGLWVIPIAIVVNVVMLAARLTKTLNIDIWNFWHLAFIGSLVAVVTNNVLYGLAAAAIAAALALFLADWTAPAVQSFYNLPGISIPHLATAPGVPFAIFTNWVIEKIPGLRDLDADPDTIQRRFGTFGDPVVLGLIIGIILGILGNLGTTGVQAFIVNVLQVGVNLAAVMLLLPRMVQILMEGLIPVSEAAREYLQKRAADREIYIGLDSAILIGHPAAISTALVLVPIAILLSIILPGNRVLLFADLAVIPFVVALFAPLMKGNIVRMIIAGTLELAVGFYLAMSLAPLFTSAAVDAGFELPANASQITSIADGFLWPGYVFAQVTDLLGAFGLLVLLGLLAATIWAYRRRPEAWERAAGAPIPAPEEIVPIPQVAAD